MSPLRWMATALGVGLLLFVPAALLISRCGPSEGIIEVEGGAHGDFALRVADCHGLQPYGRFGVSAHGSGPADGAILVTEDPVRGTAVQIEVPDTCGHEPEDQCTVFDVPRAACETFEAEIQPTRTTVHDVPLLRGHVTLDCALPDGARVYGQAVFDGC